MDTREPGRAEIAALMQRIEKDQFEEHLAGYIAKHTGVKLAKLKPRPPEA